MAKPQYRTKQHAAMVAQYRRLVDSGNGWCAEPVCLMPTRYIPPGAPVDAAHDPTGQTYIGPAHPKCNRTEGAVRGNEMRRRSSPRRWIL